MFLTAQAQKDARPISDLIGRVRVVADVRTNALLITTLAENRDAMRQLVESLDVPSPKVFVSVRLIEVSRTNASYIGVRYTSTPSLFSSSDFDNGVQTNLGINWQTAFHNGVLTSSRHPRRARPVHPRALRQPHPVGHEPDDGQQPPRPDLRRVADPVH